MTIVTTPPPNTELWAKNERMCESPNWHGVSPEVIARRARPWNQDPDDVPWLDRPDADARLEACRREGRLTADEAERLQKWITDGYFVLPDAVRGDEAADLDGF